MSDNQSAAGAAQDGNDAGQQGAGAQAGNANSDQQNQGASQGATQPSANKLIKDFADSRGVTVAALLEQFTDMENSSKTELQRIEGERDQFKGKYEGLSNKYRTVVAKSAVTEAASNLNAIDSTAVFAIARDSLEFNDDGDPTNVETVLKDIQKNHPALFRAANGSGDGGKGGAAHQANDINSLLRSMAQDAT